MKLSEMNSEQLARTMASLTPLLCAMAEDERVAEAIDRFTEEEAGGESAVVRGAALLKVIVPVILQEYSDEFFRAAAILTGKSEGVLRKQSGLALIRELRQCWEEELAVFFSCAGTGRQERY